MKKYLCLLLLCGCSTKLDMAGIGTYKNSGFNKTFGTLKVSKAMVGTNVTTTLDIKAWASDATKNIEAVNEMIKSISDLLMKGAIMAAAAQQNPEFQKQLLKALERPVPGP